MPMSVKMSKNVERSSEKTPRAFHFSQYIQNLDTDLDSVVNAYIRKWLDILISGTRSNVFLERNKFGLNICPPSIKCTQCQTVLRNSLEESPSDSFKDFHILRHDERHWHWQNAATARILSYVLNRIIIESVIFNGVESTSIKRSP